MLLKLVRNAEKPQEKMATKDEQMNIIILGHVDHGKSTLIGRLLYDTNSLPDGKYEQLVDSCAKRGTCFEWSFLMDTLQAERNQGVTIDTSHIGFKTARRDYVIIDAPGHKEFLKNMISGAAASEAALVMIDATEGVKEQSRRHGYLLQMLGIHQVAVLINKMDAIGYDQARFVALEKEYRDYLASIGVTPVCVIPVSARNGDNLTEPSPQMAWYAGPAVAEALDNFERAPGLHDLPLRFPVQDIYKFDERRIIAGRIESGSLSVGDELLFSPMGQRVRVATIEEWHAAAPVMHATAGQSVGITLSEQIFIERGHVASHVVDPPMLSTLFRAKLFWLDRKPLQKGKRYTLRLCTSEYKVDVKTIERVIDVDRFSPIAHQRVEHGAVAEIVFKARSMISLDAFGSNPRMGRFVLVDDYDICAGGIIDMDGFADQRTHNGIASQNLTATQLKVTPHDRALANGHTGGILWFTGLSGSGKSTLAVELQQRLFAKGYQAYVLDGDNVRSGLNKDLGFSAADRSENIRRVSEVASLFAQAGVIVITSFISPYEEDRILARAAAPQHFSVVHISADLRICEQRDPKGLYKKARAGNIPEFTGISAPYESPENPELAIDTSQLDVSECMKVLLDYVKRKFVEPVDAEKALEMDDG